jgi:pimeloyl-ACP methyl ester carboxylesterase
MTTWVLLRGLMREERHWGDFAHQFRVGLGEAEVVTLDFPGNGSLHAQPSNSSVEEMAKYCHDRLAQLGYAPPYNVLALSLGAMVAVEWSRQQPEEIERMVLINTSLAPHNPFYHRLRPVNYLSLARFLIAGGAARRERLILRLTSNIKRTPEQQAQLLEQWVRYAQESPIARTNILRQLYAAISYRAAPAAPRVPLLLLASLQDRLVSAQCSLALQQRWGCEIRSHESAGHDLPLDDGSWVIEQVRQWVATAKQV